MLKNVAPLQWASGDGMQTTVIGNQAKDVRCRKTAIALMVLLLAIVSSRSAIVMATPDGASETVASACEVTTNNNFARHGPMVSAVVVSNSFEWIYGGGIAADRLRHRVHVDVEVSHLTTNSVGNSYQVRIQGVRVDSIYHVDVDELDPVESSFVMIPGFTNEVFRTGLVFRVEDIWVNDPLSFDNGKQWPPSQELRVQVEIDQIKLHDGSQLLKSVGPFVDEPNGRAFLFASGEPHEMELPTFSRVMAEDTGWVGWPSTAVGYKAIPPEVRNEPGGGARQWVPYTE